jgi:hypothetical protein
VLRARHTAAPLASAAGRAGGALSAATAGAAGTAAAAPGSGGGSNWSSSLHSAVAADYIRELLTRDIPLQSRLDDSCSRAGNDEAGDGRVGRGMGASVLDEESVLGSIIAVGCEW